MVTEENGSFMESDGDVETARANVQTYVPVYQKKAWADHADELDMSLSEFVRSMVQAGRRGFSPPERPSQTDGDEEVPGTPSSDRNSGGSSLEERVVQILTEDDYFEWDELVAALTDDVEDRLEETLQDLQSSNRVRYSGRNGGYTLE